MRCRTRLDFASVLKFASILGLCAGVTSIPIFLIIQSDKLVDQPQFILMAVLFAPLGGLLNGLLYGLLGYLPYRWLTARVNVHTYSGEFVPLNDGKIEV